MKTKKLLSVILAVMMIAAAVPMAFAATDISSGLYSQYQFFEEGIKFEGYVVNFYNTTYDDLGIADCELEWKIIEGTLPEGLELVTTERELLVAGTVADELGSYIFTVTLTATSPDGTVYTAQKECEVEVVEQSAETKIALFFADLKPEVSMNEAAAVNEVIDWANNTWLAGLDGFAELEAEVEAELSIASSYYDEEAVYTAPVAGDKNDPDGTDGSLTAYVVINAEESILVSTIEIIIKAAPWEDTSAELPPAEEPAEEEKCCLCACNEATQADDSVPGCFKDIMDCIHRVFHSFVMTLKAMGILD